MGKRKLRSRENLQIGDSHLRDGNNYTVIEKTKMVVGDYVYMLKFESVAEDRWAEVRAKLNPTAGGA